MYPTPKLRFVERQSNHWEPADLFQTTRTIRVLQQWFAYDIDYPATKGEWKDVPLEKENV